MHLLGKSMKVVTEMNAEIIIASCLRLIEGVDAKIHHSNSYILPKFSLSEMSDKLLRDRVRDKEQNKYFKQNLNTEDDVFKMTKIPTFESSIEQGLQYEGRGFKDFLSQSADLGLKSQKEKKEEMEVPKFDWGNGNYKPQITDNKPLVYTFFGSEERIIEERKVKLMDILKTGGGMSIGDIAKVFPGLNSKTLQRDLLELMRERKVIMLGKKRWSKYYLK
jgi:hypothetical protein